MGSLSSKLGSKLLGPGWGSKELGVEVCKSKAVICARISFLPTQRFGYQFEIFDLFGNFSAKSVKGKPVSDLVNHFQRVLSKA